MSRKASVATFALILTLLSGLTMALPLASAQTTTQVSIPVGSSVGQSSFPAYSPANITVIIGVNNTVTWTNHDTADHTVYSTSTPTGVAAFNSPIIAPNDTYTYTFAVAGVYQYHCNLHPLWMQGSVTVLNASTTPTPEFPVAALAVILFAVIAAIAVIAPRLKPVINAGPAAGTSGRAAPTDV